MPSAGPFAQPPSTQRASPWQQLFKLNNNALFGGTYLRYGVWQRYVYDPGVSVLGVAAADGTPCEVVKQCAARMWYQVAYDAARLDAKPILPSPVSDDTNLVLLGAEIVPAAPGVAPNGQSYVYQVAGLYTYALLVPVWVDRGLAMGATGIDKADPRTAHILRPTDFVKMSFILSATGQGGNANATWKPAPGGNAGLGPKTTLLMGVEDPGAGSPSSPAQ